MTLPILYSFRRCPYAMRARLAIAASAIDVELREIVLREKPAAFLAASPSATVPCLAAGAQNIDESLDIMKWALAQNDPENWLDMPSEGHDLIAQADGEFKTALDQYKYASRHPEIEATEARARASLFLTKLDGVLNSKPWLYGDRPSLADMAILPFVRQFAHVDIDWFERQPWPHLLAWLNAFKSSPRFSAIMTKYPQWKDGDSPTQFP